MTYDDIIELLCLVSSAWQPLKYLVKEKRMASRKYTAIIKRRSDKWNLQWPAPPPSLRRPVFVNMRIINASTEEPKCLFLSRLKSLRDL